MSKLKIEERCDRRGFIWRFLAVLCTPLLPKTLQGSSWKHPSWYHTVMYTEPTYTHVFHSTGRHYSYIILDDLCDESENTEDMKEKVMAWYRKVKEDSNVEVK